MKIVGIPTEEEALKIKEKVDKEWIETCRRTDLYDIFYILAVTVALSLLCIVGYYENIFKSTVPMLIALITGLIFVFLIRNRKIPPADFNNYPTAYQYFFLIKNNKVLETRLDGTGLELVIDENNVVKTKHVTILFKEVRTDVSEKTVNLATSTLEVPYKKQDEPNNK